MTTPFERYLCGHEGRLDDPTLQRSSKRSNGEELQILYRAIAKYTSRVNIQVAVVVAIALALFLVKPIAVIYEDMVSTLDEKSHKPSHSSEKLE